MLAVHGHAVASLLQFRAARPDLRVSFETLRRIVAIEAC